MLEVGDLTNPWSQNVVPAVHACSLCSGTRDYYHPNRFPHKFLAFLSSSSTTKPKTLDNLPVVSQPTTTTTPGASTKHAAGVEYRLFYIEEISGKQKYNFERASLAFTFSTNICGLKQIFTTSVTFMYLNYTHVCNISHEHPSSMHPHAQDLHLLMNLLINDTTKTTKQSKTRWKLCFTEVIDMFNTKKC